MQRILYLLLPILLLTACTPESTIDGYSVNQRPVVTVISPTNGSVVGTNFSLAYTSTDADGTNLQLFLRINNGPEITLVPPFSNTLIFSNQSPGYPEFTLYARDDRGLYSRTNTIAFIVSSPGFTEIDPGKLDGIGNGSITLGDLDNDGDPDIVLTGHNGTDKISKVYINNGSGNMTPLHSDNLPGIRLSSSVLEDFDGDGDLDLLLTGNTNSTYSGIFMNNGNGFFTEETSSTLHDLQTGSSVSGDINGDGYPDLVITGSLSGVYSKIYTNDGTGIFTELSPTNLHGVFYSSIALGDLDRDGDLDLILTGQPNPVITRIYINDGTGVFTEKNPGPLPGVTDGSVRLGDLDGDGDLDLVVTGNMNPGATSQIFHNDGNGNFTEINPDILTAVFNAACALGDLDGDGDLDIIISGRESQATSFGVSKIYLNNGQGICSETVPGNLMNLCYSTITLGDFDGDGDLDLIISGLSGTTYITKIYRNDWNRGGYAPYTVPKFR